MRRERQERWDTSMNIIIHLLWWMKTPLKILRGALRAVAVAVNCGYGVKVLFWLGRMVGENVRPWKR